MKLYFQNSQGKKRVIADVETKEEAIEHIHTFCEERNFRIYYTRQWERDNRRFYDVGSHTEFFILELEGESDEQNE